MGGYKFRTPVALIVTLFVLIDLISADCPANKTGPSCTRNNFAYNKYTEQKEIWNSHSSRYAVDGNITSCTVMTPHVDDPWWKVDLDKDMVIEGFKIQFSAFSYNEAVDNSASFTMEIQQDGASNWTTCAHYNSLQSNPVESVCNQATRGRYFRISAFQPNMTLELCEVGVYGSCLKGHYGSHCQEECGECKQFDQLDRACDKTTGHCPSGCNDGFQQPLCKDRCPILTYGQDCAQNCGNCQFNVTCNVFDGECSHQGDYGQCMPGYQPPYCALECEQGRWGVDCQERCGYCINGESCEPKMGNCTNGCMPGYQYTLDNKLCMTACEDGSWGDQCIFSCGNCLVPDQLEPGPCNKSTGICDKGCAPGYHNETGGCRDICPDGRWGLNCAEVCGQCAYYNSNTSEWESITCRKDDGVCSQGCIIGIGGVRCDRPCSSGFYGQNCQEECGKCRNGVDCEKIAGACPADCADGYLGTNCTQKCPAGQYGYSCQYTCPVNCGDVCNHEDGSCTCKDGYTGSKCADVCPANHYGKECKFQCGYCKEGTKCSQVDGTCLEGCQPEYSGLKCDAKKIIEQYEKSYGSVIGGAIGGTLALALIIAFAVWVIWRYRKDKSIHFKALAASLRNSVRRMSIRGRNSLRRSIQRLSMRGRRGADQQTLSDNAERPHMSNGTRGRKVPRMYEGVKIHSNTIHEDDFPRIYLQLQESTPDGRTLLHDAFQSFLAQRPKAQEKEQNGSAGKTNVAFNSNGGFSDIQLHMDSDGVKIPEFLPLGSNLSGFLLVNEAINSKNLWNHLQQRQIETVISIGKEASTTWRPGERVNIGHDVLECIDVQLHGSHRESKLTIQRNVQSSSGRRAIRHLELFFWTTEEVFPNPSTLLIFLETFQRLHQSQRERSILVNYINMHEQAVLFTLVASTVEILSESKRADVLRTVAIGGKATEKAVRTFEGFKFLHDVIFQYITSKDNKVLSQQHQRQQYTAGARQPQAGPSQEQRSHDTRSRDPRSHDQRANQYQPRHQLSQEEAPPSYKELREANILPEPQIPVERQRRVSPGYQQQQQKPVSPGYQQQTRYNQQQPTASGQYQNNSHPNSQRSPHYTSEQSFRPVTSPRSPNQPAFPQSDKTFQPISVVEKHHDRPYEHITKPVHQEHGYTHLQSVQDRGVRNVPQNERPLDAVSRNEQGKRYDNSRAVSNQRSPASSQQYLTLQPTQEQTRPRSKSDNRYLANDDDGDDDDGGFKSRPRMESASTVV